MTLSDGFFNSATVDNGVSMQKEMTGRRSYYRASERGVATMRLKEVRGEIVARVGRMAACGAVLSYVGTISKELGESPQSPSSFQCPVSPLSRHS